jgi:hypothetical protein
MYLAREYVPHKSSQPCRLILNIRDAAASSKTAGEAMDTDFRFTRSMQSENIENEQSDSEPNILPK